MRQDKGEPFLWVLKVFKRGHLIAWNSLIWLGVLGTSIHVSLLPHVWDSIALTQIFFVCVANILLTMFLCFMFFILCCYFWCYNRKIHFTVFKMCIFNNNYRRYEWSTHPSGIGSSVWNAKAARIFLSSQSFILMTGYIKNAIYEKSVSPSFGTQAMLDTALDLKSEGWFSPFCLLLAG